MDDYRLAADTLEADIRAGRLRAGERLMPQREFARTRGIASSTAARVYQELIRRGLATGEVGRGTFVLGPDQGKAEPVASPPGTLIDLEANFPILPGQSALVSAALDQLLKPAALESALDLTSSAAAEFTRQTASAFLAQQGWVPNPGNLLFTGNGRQSIAAALSCLVPHGQRLGVEELTYPVVKSIAGRLGVQLVPIRMDEHGMIPAQLAAAHIDTPLSAVYLQPTLHNPLGITMPPHRRTEIASALQKHGLIAIEDRINSYLTDEDIPLAAFAPEHTVLIDSLTKRIGPGLSLGIIAPPPDLKDQLSATIRSGTWSAQGFALAASTILMSDGTAAQIVRDKRRDAVLRQQILRQRLAGFTLRTSPYSYHAWWQLPELWHTETFVAAAARKAIAVSPGAAFTVTSAAVPNAIRLATSSPDIRTFSDTLEVLAGIARRTPDDVGMAY